MKKIFSIFVMAALTTGAMAEYWFVDPAATATAAQGYTWEDALSPTKMQGMLSQMFPGDTMFIKGGTISIKALTDQWEIKENIAIIGGLDPALTGTNVVIPAYPSATPTIFDGDVNGNGKPDAGDAETLIRVNLENNREATVILQGLVMRNTYHYQEGEATGDLDTYLMQTAALRLICGTAFIKNCEIYNNWTGNRGSQTVTVVGANAHFMDCDLHHGVSVSRGGLIRARDYFNGGKEDDPVHPSVVIERCCLRESSALGGKKINASGPYGGAVHASTGELFAINSTFVLDSCYSKGGSLRGNAAGITLISCTFGQNFGTRVDTTDKACSYGSSIGLDNDVPIRFMNTIVVDDKDKGNKATCPIYTDGNTITADQFFLSNDYNMFGTIYIYVNGGKQDSATIASLMQTHDLSNINKNNDFTRIFGDVYTNLKNNGGSSKTIMPLAMLNGAPVSDLQDYADQYCPEWTEVDASVDQRGYKRDADVTCVGAAAFEGEKPSSLETVKNAQCTMHNVQFNVLGQPVGENYRGIVILKGQKYLLQ